MPPAGDVWARYAAFELFTDVPHLFWSDSLGWAQVLTEGAEGEVGELSEKTTIAWTQATWSPVSGCTRVSDGCLHCYIERTTPFRVAHRRFDGSGLNATTGVQFHPERLGIPLRWRKPKRIFVCSMADLFHQEVSDDRIAEIFAVMAANYCWDRPTHTFQVLTKRHARMRSLLSSEAFRAKVARIAAGMTDGEHADGVHDAIYYHYWPLPNVWLGVTAENQSWFEIRTEVLRGTPAAVRWVSLEPMLGRVDIDYLHGPGTAAGMDWVVVGGESGPGARPMHPDWARSVRDQCVAAGVPFMFKQWGEWTPETGHRYSDFELLDGDPGAFVMRVGTKRAGRELDGRIWEQYPETAEVQR